MFESGESVEFSGKCIAHLAADPKLMAKTGRILMTSDLARDGFDESAFWPLFKNKI
jgi:hypothetical protein